MSFISKSSCPPYTPPPCRLVQAVKKGLKETVIILTYRTLELIGHNLCSSTAKTYGFWRKSANIVHIYLTSRYLKCAQKIWNLIYSIGFTIYVVISVLLNKVGGIQWTIRILQLCAYIFTQYCMYSNVPLPELGTHNFCHVRASFEREAVLFARYLRLNKYVHCTCMTVP